MNSMNQEQFIANIQGTFAVGLDLIKKKNSDYANSHNPFRNFESASIIGLKVEHAILVRILDKISRISNLIDKDAAVKDESLEDTIIDAINYLAILKAYRDENIRSTNS